jgi:hypothetical protein
MGLVQLALPFSASRCAVQAYEVIRLEVVPEEIGHSEATELALVGDGEAIAACAGTGN